MTAATIKKIIIYSFKALIYILPWFFIPWTGNGFGEDALAKLFLFTLFLAWMFAWLAWYHYRFKLDLAIWSARHWPLAALLAVGLLSSIFSLNPYVSVWGDYHRPVLPLAFLMLLLGLVVLGLIVVKNWGQKRVLLRTIVLSLAWVNLIAATIFLITFIGLIASDSVLLNYIKSAIGPLEDQSALFALGLLAGLGARTANSREWLFNKNWQRVVLNLSLGAAAVNLISINFQNVWLALFIAWLALVLLNWKESMRTERIKNGIFLFLILVLTVMNQFFFSTRGDQERLARQLKLEPMKSYQVSAAAWRDNFLFGQGPDTYAYAVSRYRSLEFNNDFFWYLRFMSAGTFAAELMAASGLAGLLAWLSLMAISLYAIKTIKFPEYYPRRLRSFFIALWLFFLALGWFYSLNIILLFFWFAFVSLWLAWSGSGEKSYFNFGTAWLPGMAAVWLLGLAYMAPMLGAEMLFARGQDSQTIKGAIAWNQNRYQYYTALAKSYQQEALALAGQKEKAAAYAELSNLSLAAARQAMYIAPQSVVPAETLAMIYRDLGQYSDDSALYAIEEFGETIRLEPTNPVLHLELGKLYYRRGAYSEAIKYLGEAARLKDNYYNAELYLAKARVSSGMYDEAMFLLDKWIEERPSAELYYEQGRALVGRKEWGAAEEKLRQAVSMEPLYSNALFLLAITLETLDKPDEALFYLKKVEQLNPDNEEVRGRINRLEGVK